MFATPYNDPTKKFADTLLPAVILATLLMLLPAKSKLSVAGSSTIRLVALSMMSGNLFAICYSLSLIAKK
jgi:hypothetical protein